MKIVIIGGTGIQGRTTVRDLTESLQVEEIFVVDLREDQAKEYAASFKDNRLKGGAVDANNVEETANVIKGYDAVINTAQYYVNINVMKACLKAGCHYNDIGGMFHTTRKQLELFDDFRKAGLSAVLGIGAPPGLTNVLSRYGYDRLDKVDAVHVSFALVDNTDMKGIDVFVPGYSIKTIMEEFREEAWEFIDGDYRAFPAGSEAEEIVYPEPVGRCTCVHTLHSEPATIPNSYRDKGIKEVTWKLGLPTEFEQRARFLATIGFAGSETIMVQNETVVPREVLGVVVDKQVREKLEGIELKPDQAACARAQVIGSKNKKKTEYIVDCIIKTPLRLGGIVDVATGVPPSIVAQMQVGGKIDQIGVWGPEQVIAPQYFFDELAKREMHVEVTTREDLT